MSCTFLEIAYFEDNFLQYLYGSHPQLFQMSFAQQLREITAKHPQCTRLLAPYLDIEPLSANLLIANAAPLQDAWANEFGIDPQESRYVAILMNQIIHLQPEILYVNDTSRIDSGFLRQIGYTPSFTVGYLESLPSQALDLSLFDLILTNDSTAIETAKQWGAYDCKQFLPSFPFESFQQSVESKAPSTSLVVYADLHSLEIFHYTRLLSTVQDVAKDFNLRLIVPDYPKTDPFGLETIVTRAYVPELIEELRNALMVILPPEASTHSLVLALGLGCPVLCGAPQSLFLPEEELGSYRCSESLRKEMQRIIQDTTYRKKLANGGYRACQAKYSKSSRLLDLNKLLLDGLKEKSAALEKADPKSASRARFQQAIREMGVSFSSYQQFHTEP